MLTNTPSALNPVVPTVPEPASTTNVMDEPPTQLTLLSLADFDNDDIQAMNQELQSCHTAYRFSYPKGGYRQYYSCRPLKGPHSPADDHTTMQNEENLTWVPIPTGYTAPHTPEDYIKAVNDLHKQDCQCIAYTHPEAQKAFDELNASCHPSDPKIQLK